MNIAAAISTVTGAVVALVKSGFKTKVFTALVSATAAIAETCRSKSAQQNAMDAAKDLGMYFTTKSRKYLLRATARLTNALDLDDEVEELAQAQREIEAEQAKGVDSEASA